MLVELRKLKENKANFNTEGWLLQHVLAAKYKMKATSLH